MAAGAEGVERRPGPGQTRAAAADRPAGAGASTAALSHRVLLAAALVILTGIAAAIRLWHLGVVPPGFHYDEALEALEAWRVLTVPGYHPIFFPGDFGLAPTFVYLDSLAFRFLPATPVVARTIAALIGTATIPALYALGRELVLADRRVPPATPLLAAATLAVLRWHVNFSRVAIEPILVPLYLTVILWALFYGLRTNRIAAWLVLGAALGLCVYAYPAAWLLPPLVLALVGCLALLDRPRLAGRARGLILAGVLAGLIIAPLAILFARNPGLVLMRTDQVAAVGGERSLAETLASLGANLVKALGMFSFAGDTDPRSNIPGAPALDPLLAVPFYLGVALAVWRWRRPASVTLLLASAAMLANTVLSQYAPHFRRSLGLTPLVALFVGLGLASVWSWRHAVAAWARERGHAGLARIGSGAVWRAAAGLIVAGILLGAAVLNTRAYFVDWGQSPDQFYAYDEGLWEISSYAAGLPAGQNILVTPRPAKDATLAFAWRTGPAVRHFDGRSAVVVPQMDRDATYIVIEHEDFRAAGLLTQLFPDVVVDRVFRDRQGQVYASALRVPAGSTPARRPEYTPNASWPGIALAGYDLDKTTYHPGDIVYLQLWWRATAAPGTNWTVFTHLLGPAKPDGSTVWAGKDSIPGQGSAPTSAWQAGDLILDEYQIQIGTEVPAGDYQIEIGLYNPAAGGRRAVLTNPPGADHFVLGHVQVQ